MSSQLSRQIALMTVFVTCILLVMLAVALGLDASAHSALSQAFPLAVVCGAALVFLIADPFTSR